MNLIDIIVLFFALVMLILDFRKGFIISLASLAALILGVYLAIHFSRFTAEFLSSTFDMSSLYLSIISFAVTFLIVLAGVLLLGKLVEQVVDRVGMGVLNHLAGAVLGLVKSLLILSVVFYLISIADPNQKLITPKAKQESFFYPYVAPVFPSVLKWTGTNLMP